MARDRYHEWQYQALARPVDGEFGATQDIAWFGEFSQDPPRRARALTAAVLATTAIMVAPIPVEGDQEGTDHPLVEAPETTTRPALSIHDQQAFTIDPAALNEPSPDPSASDLTWLPGFPDRVVRPPITPGAFETPPEPDAVGDSGAFVEWLPTYPDRTIRLALSIPDQPTFVEPPVPDATGDTGAVLDWLSIFPDRLVRRPRLIYPIAGLGPLPGAEFGALNDVFDALPPPIRRLPLTELQSFVIDPVEPTAADPSASDLTWLPTYPDRLVRPPHPEGAFVEPPERDELGDGGAVLEWLPEYPDRLVRRPITPGVFVEPPATDPTGDTGEFLEWRSIHPDRLVRRLPVYQAFAIDPNALNVPSVNTSDEDLTWLPSFPDRLVRRPQTPTVFVEPPEPDATGDPGDQLEWMARGDLPPVRARAIPEYLAFTTDPTTLGDVGPDTSASDLTWLPTAPDRLVRAPLTPGLFAEPPERDELGDAGAYLEWTPTSPDRLDRARTLPEYPAFTIDPNALNEAGAGDTSAEDLSWAPSFPATFPRRWAFYDSSGRGTLHGAESGALTGDVTGVLPPRRRALALSAIQSFAMDPVEPTPPDPSAAGLTWLPEYPDRLVRAPQTPGLFARPPEPDDLGDSGEGLEWTPRFPDRLVRARRLVEYDAYTIDPNALNVIVVASDPNGLYTFDLTIFPDRLVRPALATANQQPFAIDPDALNVIPPESDPNGLYTYSLVEAPDRLTRPSLSTPNQLAFVIDPNALNVVVTASDPTGLYTFDLVSAPDRLVRPQPAYPEGPLDSGVLETPAITIRDTQAPVEAVEVADTITTRDTQIAAEVPQVDDVIVTRCTQVVVEVVHTGDCPTFTPSPPTPTAPPPCPEPSVAAVGSHECPPVPEPG